MDTESFFCQYWDYVARQDEEGLRGCFCADATIRWHNTNEEFTLEEFLRANCDYPGNWHGEVERIVPAGDTVVTAAHIWSADISCHVASFFRLEGEQIKTLDEYWGDDGSAPQWRLDMHIGRPIRQIPA